ncbi:polysaccharide deacetylase family protein [Flavobacterium sp.]|uniref:polysaccharide deacetylase family protein n=1 Tax=Flavobacterium sp. TaxID=239 RepID=UPI002B4AB556|nr:polysaccharide deacetylase family protein [Flavobacterium sp.]HLF51076.1 polysaccharide deacetylase family protein [Flavobacterium sp.]
MLKHKYITIFCISILVILSFLSFYSEVKWWIFLLLFIFWLGLTSWGSFDIRLGYFIKTYCNNPEKERKIAISFDDGPHEMTEKVLDVLQKHHVKATFFCIGSQIEKHPEMFQRIIQEGHVVGNHTFTHTKSFGFLSTQKVVEEISRTNRIIERLSGKKVLFFRPPFGVTNPNVSKAISVTKHKVIGWNIRSLDTVIEDETKILERVKNKVVPGGIILLHDTSLKTVNVLEQLLLFLQSENYDVITIDKLLKIPAYED